MLARTHFKTSSDLQTKLTVNYPFFASQSSFGYLLSQENGYFVSQLFFSNSSEVLK